jgi:hypothetical protein
MEEAEHANRALVIEALDTLFNDATTQRRSVFGHRTTSSTAHTSNEAATAQHPSIAVRNVRFADHKTIVHPELGPIELDCQVLFTEDQSQMLLVFTAPPRTQAYEKLQLLAVIGQEQFPKTERTVSANLPDESHPVQGRTSTVPVLPGLVA